MTAMSHSDLSGIGLAPKQEELLRRAYALSSDEESRALYSQWATSYDSTMIEGLQYQSPRLVAARLAALMSQGESPVLDIGCGTGLAGDALAALGFGVIDGIDISPDMMAVAREKGCYRDLHRADLNANLPLPGAHYAGAVCCGTFTSGHVRANCLDEIMRVLQLGAPFVFTVKLEVWESFGFKDTLSRLEQEGKLQTLAYEPGCLYANSPENDGLFCSVRRL
jgi:ubiquinone/menaquinone biosynthesis C-methylase UbiE